MIEIETRRLGNHEILHAIPAGKHAQPLPVVVFYHGFTSSKLVYSYFAVALAQAGFRVVMPDAPDHGARFTGDEQVRLGQFWQILHGSLTEFAGLRDALYQAGLVASERGTARSRTPRAGRRPTVRSRLREGVRTCQVEPGPRSEALTDTGSIRSSSKVYVAATNRRTCSPGASRTR